MLALAADDIARQTLLELQAILAQQLGNLSNFVAKLVQKALEKGQRWLLTGANDMVMAGQLDRSNVEMLSTFHVIAVGTR